MGSNHKPCSCKNEIPTCQILQLDLGLATSLVRFHIFSWVGELTGAHPHMPWMCGAWRGRKTEIKQYHPDASDDAYLCGHVLDHRLMNFRGSGVDVANRVRDPGAPLAVPPWLSMEETLTLQRYMLEMPGDSARPRDCNIKHFICVF